MSLCGVTSAEPLPHPGWVRHWNSPCRPEREAAATLSCDKSPQCKHSTQCPLPGCKSAAAGTRASYQERPHPSQPSSAHVLPTWDSQERKRMLGYPDPLAAPTALSGTRIPAELCLHSTPTPRGSSSPCQGSNSCPSASRKHLPPFPLAQQARGQDNCNVFL